jgi:hypothetical protein
VKSKCLCGVSLRMMRFCWPVLLSASQSHTRCLLECSVTNRTQHGNPRTTTRYTIGCSMGLFSPRCSQPWRQTPPGRSGVLLLCCRRRDAVGGRM